jgi:general stress protein CsbA
LGLEARGNGGKTTQRGEAMDASVEKGFAKHVWIVFLTFGLGAVIAGLSIVAGVVQVDPPSAERTTSLTLDQLAARVPGIESYVSGLTRQLGNFMIAMGVLLATIAAIPYRRGDKWAWYACLVMPIVLAVQLANSFAIYHFTSGGFLWELDLVSLAVVLAGLFMSYRTFFPKERSNV